jgi:hypothetical protein
MFLKPNFGLDVIVDRIITYPATIEQRFFGPANTAVQYTNRAALSMDKIIYFGTRLHTRTG